MAFVGNEMRVYLSNNGYTWVGGEQSNNVNRSAEAVDVSDKSTDWNKYIAGAKSMTISVTAYTDNASTSAQATLLTKFTAGEVVKVFVGKVTGSGASATPVEGDLCDGIITSISETNSRGEVASRDIEIQVTGAPTHYPNS